jgi:hypothetical protein
VRVMKNTSYGFGWTDPRGVFVGGNDNLMPTHTRSVYNDDYSISLMENYEVHHGNKPETATGRDAASA